MGEVERPTEGRCTKVEYVKSRLIQAGALVGGREKWQSFVTQMTHICENINGGNGETDHYLQNSTIFCYHVFHIFCPWISE
jgi:hypothetical protein